jgi:hypothetical protein
MDWIRVAGSGCFVVNGNGHVGSREWSPCLGANSCGADQMVRRLTLPFPHRDWTCLNLLKTKRHLLLFKDPVRTAL